MFLNIQSILAGLGAVLIWSFSPVLIKVQALAMPLSLFLVLRYGLSTVLLSPLIFQLRKENLKVSISGWLGLCICLVAHLGCQVFAIRELPIVWYVVFFSLSPLISLLLVQRKLSWQTWFYIGLCVIGTWVFISQEKLTSISLSSVIALVVTVLFWAGLTKFMKDIQSQLSDLKVTALSNLISFLLFAGYWLVDGLPFQSMNFSNFASIFVLSLGVPLGFFLFSFCLRKTPVFAISSQYLEPVFGAAFGVLVFKEVMTLPQQLGTLIIIAAAYKITVSLKGIAS